MKYFAAFVSFLRRTSVWIILLPIALQVGGALSNQIVLFANHDRFPVSINLVKLHKFSSAEDIITMSDGVIMIDETHCIMTSKTHLNLLADVFDFHDSIQSIGDLMLEFGEWLWIFMPFVWAFAVVSKLQRA